MRFILCLGLIFWSSLTLAVEIMMVKADQAIVYTDIQGVTPVGYITRGRNVKVGSVAKGLNRMRPIIVSGKVCYIKESDLSSLVANTTEDRKTIEQDKNNYSPVVYKERTTRFQNGFAVTLGRQGTGEEWENYTLTHAQKQTSTISDLGLTYHRHNEKFDYALGFRRFSSQVGIINLSSLAWHADLYYQAYEKNKFLIRPGIGIINALTLSSGFMGYKLGADFNYRVHEHWNILAGLFYQSMKGKDLELIPSYAPVTISMSGWNTSLGLEYLF
jgi:hypothetical protein